MSTASFAILLAILEVLIGLPLLVFPKATSDWLIRLTLEPILYRLVGMFFLILCALPLIDNPQITVSLDGLIRLMAWWGAIKSLIICWWPHAHARLAERILSRRSAQVGLGALAVMFGLLLFWAGLVLR